MMGLVIKVEAGLGFSVVYCNHAYTCLYIDKCMISFLGHGVTGKHVVVSTTRYAVVADVVSRVKLTRMACLGALLELLFLAARLGA